MSGAGGRGVVEADDDTIRDHQGFYPQIRLLDGIWLHLGRLWRDSTIQ
jgi:hypothetical protein